MADARSYWVRREAIAKRYTPKSCGFGTAKGLSQNPSGIIVFRRSTTRLFGRLAADDLPKPRNTPQHQVLGSQVAVCPTRSGGAQENYYASPSFSGAHGYESASIPEANPIAGRESKGCSPAMSTRQLSPLRLDTKAQVNSIVDTAACLANRQARYAEPAFAGRSDPSSSLTRLSR